MKDRILTSLIAAGEMVVDEGYHKLTPGIKVRIGEAPEAKEEDK